MFKFGKLLLVLLGTLLSMEGSAAPITREQARKKAVTFLKDTKGSLVLAPVTNQRKLSPRRAASATAETELYYVFNRGDKEGYVIVSGDDRTQSVLGYTDNGEFDYNTIPDNMRAWLDRRAAQLEDLSNQPETTKPSKLPKHPAVAELLTTRWNQGWPYNNECPMYFNEGRSVTGCVATAMAQILYYQRDKSVTETQADMPGYTGRANHDTFGHLQVDGIAAGAPIDWENMLNTYSSSASAKQQLAVAQLMHYCGVSVEMDYTNSASGAYSYQVETAFKKYFGYGSSVRYVQQYNYTEDAWDAMIYKEVEEGRPVYISGSNGSGGHAFVCDGYDGNLCYHINWGWGGASNGFFLLSKLNPGSQGIGGSDGGYSDYEDAIIGCEPENYSEKAMPIANAAIKKLCVENWDTNGDGIFSFGEAAAVTELGEVFKGKTTITAFTELYNFTGLTSISDDAFNGCTKLASVKLPKHLKHIGARAFNNCRALKTITLPDELESIGEGAFAGCRVLPNLTIPAGIKRIEANTFESCQAFTAVELPLSVKYIGTQAFKDCTKLTAFTLNGISPQNTALGENVFEGAKLSEATLNVPQGSLAYFAQAEQWKEFGNICEYRTLAQGKFAALAVNTPFYIYNIGTGRYLTKGEAYGTQAIVADTDTPMRYELKRSDSMPDGTYYLSSDDTGNSARKILFRTNEDPKVGSGVNACFVDGTLSNKAYWKVQPVENAENIYTFQMPQTQTGYNADQFLGVQPDHKSNAASPTYGIYSDVSYTDYPENCQWVLVTYDESSVKNYLTAQELKNLLAIAKKNSVNYSYEQTIYESASSTTEDLEKACRKLRKKLNFINFVDNAVRDICKAQFDVDFDGEISLTEASAVSSIETEFSENTAITDLSDLQYFTGADYLAGTAFKACTALRTVTLPDQLTGIYYRAFYNCSGLESISIGSHLTNIGDNAFYNCKKLKEVRVAVANPAAIKLGSNVFQNVTLANAVLYVPQGSKALYEQADVWKNFGTIKEMRTLQTPAYAEPQANTNYYIYNVGLNNYITKGEAYGTQAIVGKDGFVYQLRRTTSMPENTYYLYSEQAGSSNKILFRTNSDGTIGSGVKACFVDGTLSQNAWWKLAPVEGKENLYTLQVPETDSNYTEGEYLGTDTSHESKYTSNTTGLYWDINYSTSPENCQWAFLSVDEMGAAQAFYELTEKLKALLEKADSKNIEATAEHAVYDNYGSTEEEINNAILSLRSKLHYIDFIDTRAAALSINRWDDDEDGELSMEEAAAVTDLGNAFRNASTIKCFDELRYFTSLTALPAEAFRACSSLISIYIPEGVKSIGTDAFLNCSALKYVALLSPDGVVEANASALSPSKLRIFVPESLTEAYSADEFWSKASATEFTGIPTVTANPISREYGRSNPSLTFSVTGAPVNGAPTLSTDAALTTPAGEYDITVGAGSISLPNVVLSNGTLTVLRAPLTLTATSYTRNIGEENPAFEFTYSALRNREKIDNVLIQQPTLECDATPESPAGTYTIRISGAETENYEITYVEGTLTVIDPTGISGISADGKGRLVYDLQGRRISNPKRGLYIVNKKKQIIR